MVDAVEQLVARLRAGDTRALARAASLVESRHAASREILAACFPYAGGALRVGITGAAGAGKSTLVDRLARAYRDAGKTVGVVAIDPTSPFSGGAVLGDRIRMRGFEADPGFYFRSMATRGALGGLAHTTMDVTTVVEASRKDVVLIETVGVGQDELDVVKLVDVAVVVLVPGMGDDVQGLKAGILEIADVFAINKSDRDGADQLEAELRGMQSLGVAREAEWAVPIVRTAALEGVGTENLIEAIGGFAAWMSSEGRSSIRRSAQWRERILGMARDELVREIRGAGFGDKELDDLSKAVVAGRENPYVLIPRMLDRLRT